VLEFVIELGHGRQRHGAGVQDGAGEDRAGEGATCQRQEQGGEEQARTAHAPLSTTH
jgi:hypothetical protein